MRMSRAEFDAMVARNPKLAGIEAKPVGKPLIEVLAPDPKLAKRKSTEERLNKTERRWLEKMRQSYPKVGIQNITLVLGNGVRYTPDFYTPNPQTFWEVKGGFIRPDAWTKLKLAASQYPEFAFWMAQWRDRDWHLTRIQP